MGAAGEYPITPLTTTTTTTHTPLMSDAVNSYYLGLPECIFGAELNTQLITPDEARELCAKKYIQPHITDENELAAPLTEEELAQVREVFPDLQTTALPPHALSPVLRCLSDPDGMGATLTHQADTQALDDELWEAEGVLQVPPRVGRIEGAVAEEDQHAVEGGAVCKSHVQEKRHKGSLGGATPASMAASKGLWSRTTSLRDWYPDEHPFIKNQCNTDDPNETPYTMTTSGYLLYKRSYMPAMMQRREPLGFNTNDGVNYINYPYASLMRQPHSKRITRRPSWPPTRWWWHSAWTLTRCSANLCMPRRCTSSRVNPPTRPQSWTT